MIKTVIDFETYYDKAINVKELGNANYVARSSAYMVSIVNSEVKDVGTPAYIFNRYGSYLQRPDIEPWAANANFDQAWCEKEFGYLSKPWQCLLDVARGQQLPGSLAGVVNAVYGRKLDKSIRDGMQGRVYEMLDPIEQKKLLDYCLNDSVETLELINTLPPLSPIEAKLAAQTRRINRKGLRINEELVERDKQRLYIIRDHAFRSIPWTVSEAPKSPKALAQYCSLFGVTTPKSLAKSDEAFNAWVDEMAEVHPQISGVLDAMKTWATANMLLKKADTLLDRVSDEGRLPLDLIYCGAPHTRRWSSRGFNVQNLDRSPVLQDWCAKLWPEECVENPKTGAKIHPGIWSRRWVLPDEGCVFGILDFCQIEPRCLASLAGNHKFLQLIRDGYSPYEAYARKNMNWVAGNLKQQNELLYKAAKAAVLALGYGCGAGKFKTAAKTMAGLIIDLPECTRQVNAYRRAEVETINFWGQNDRIIKDAFSRGKESRGTGHIHIRMPTGEYLSHFNVEEVYAFNEQTNRNERSYASYKAYGDSTQRVFSLWGGVLTENRTQRFARDILGDALCRAEDAGFEVAMHAHDEGVFQLDKSSAESDFKELKHIMETNPVWCPEVPLEVEGGLHEHYVK
jgi:DNA polymerase